MLYIVIRQDSTHIHTRYCHLVESAWHSIIMFATKRQMVVVFLRVLYHNESFGGSQKSAEDQPFTYPDILSGYIVNSSLAICVVRMYSMWSKLAQIVLLFWHHVIHPHCRACLAQTMACTNIFLLSTRPPVCSSSSSSSSSSADFE